MEGKDVFIALYIATDYRNGLFSFASPMVFDRVGVCDILLGNIY